MITISSNITEVSRRLFQRLAKVASEPSLDAMEREIAFSVLGEMKTRIYEQGRDSSGAQIGTYTPQYMRVRTDQLPPKFTKGKQKGQPRPRYKRTSDTKVILSLTGDMERDMIAGPIKTDDGYGIGFKYPFNFQKSQWNEATYKKPIFSLTEEEKDKARIIAENFINRSIQQL